MENQKIKSHEQIYKLKRKLDQKMLYQMWKKKKHNQKYKINSKVKLNQYCWQEKVNMSFGISSTNRLTRIGFKMETIQYFKNLIIFKYIFKSFNLRGVRLPSLVTKGIGA